MKTANRTAMITPMAQDRRVARAQNPTAHSRGRDNNYRRRSPALAAMLDASLSAPTSAFGIFLDAHAVKTGMVIFYVWFAVSNWTRLLHVIENLAAYFSV